MRQESADTSGNGERRSSSSDCRDYVFLCAYCAVRPGVVYDDCDGKIVMACKACLKVTRDPDPEGNWDDEPSQREKIRRYLRACPGSSISEIADALGVGEEDGDRYRRLMSQIYSMTRDGKLESEFDRGIRSHEYKGYWIAGDRRGR